MPGLERHLPLRGQGRNYFFVEEVPILVTIFNPCLSTRRLRLSLRGDSGFFRLSLACLLLLILLHLLLLLLLGWDRNRGRL
jgi:hypothetical protein